MKRVGRTFLMILLITAFIVCALPIFAGADSTGICFTAVDDNVLDLSLRPVFIGGSPYVPWTVFGSLGITTSYFESENVALLSVGSNQIIFNLNEGTCYDPDGTNYPLSASYRNGTIYVPAWTGIIFGLTYSYISGIGYGDVVRIKSGANVLSDSDLIDAAATLMSSMYNAYFGTPTTEPPKPSSPSPSPSESDKPEDEEGGNVSLSFIGAPDEALLKTLSGYGVYVCFFLTAEQAEENGDLLRRASGEGHTLGVYCSDEEGLDEACAAIQNAAFVRPTLVTSDNADAIRETAGEKGFALYEPQKVYNSGVDDPSVINLSLPTDGTACNILLTCGENTGKLTSSILGYMAANKYTSVCLRETDIY